MEAKAKAKAKIPVIIFPLAIQGQTSKSIIIGNAKITATVEDLNMCRGSSATETQGIQEQFPGFPVDVHNLLPDDDPAINELQEQTINIETSSSDEVNMKSQSAIEMLTTKLEKLPRAQPNCTIYRVYEHLRNVNDKAYEPEVVAIGPYHRGKPNLQMLEEHKLHYLQLLLHRKKEYGIDLERLVSIIAPLEQEARKCYAEPIKLNTNEFIEMLVLDSCFIIELLRKPDSTQLFSRVDDPSFHRTWVMNSLQRDLMLFENQIPFFILCQLFNFIENLDGHTNNEWDPDIIRRLITLISEFFQKLYPGKVETDPILRYPSRSAKTIKHLLDLVHDILRPSWSYYVEILDEATLIKRKGMRFINNASWLREANVRFTKDEGGFLLEASFENGNMLLPPLKIEDRTESFFRNLIAYEEYFNHTTPYISDYVKLMDCLIDSSHDVEILSRNGIISNWLGEDQAVANMFNKLTELVTDPGDSFLYATIFDSVISHCKLRRNSWMAKLKRHYLNSPWTIISIIAAVLLLLLTIVQTVFSVLQVTIR